MNILSIIVPCYNKHKTIFNLYNEILNTIEKILITDFEIILVEIKRRPIYLIKESSYPGETKKRCEK